jgi:hypothetical protein
VIFWDANLLDEVSALIMDSVLRAIFLSLYPPSRAYFFALNYAYDLE